MSGFTLMGTCCIVLGWYDVLMVRWWYITTSHVQGLPHRLLLDVAQVVPLRQADMLPLLGQLWVMICTRLVDIPGQRLLNLEIQRLNVSYLLFLSSQDKKKIISFDNFCYILSYTRISTSASLSITDDWRCRRVDRLWLGLRLEGRGGRAVRPQHEPARGLQAEQDGAGLLRPRHRHGGVQLPPGGPRVRQGAELLHGHHVRPLHHDRGRVLVRLLDRPQVCPGQSDAGGEHTAGSLHHPGQHTEVPPSCGLHEGASPVISLSSLSWNCSNKFYFKNTSNLLISGLIRTMGHSDINIFTHWARASVGGVVEPLLSSLLSIM